LSKALVVAEKPSVARDIATALGGFENHDSYLENDKFVISWAVGHLLELIEPEEIDPKYKRWLLEDLPILPEQFRLKAKSGQSERLKVLNKLFQRKDISDLVNACDAGREGELIFRELIQHFEVAKPTRRLWLRSMTKEAIRTGFETLRPGSDFDGLGDAASCRSEADWLIGMNATRALTRRMKTRTETTAWSAGRVQTPTLALLAEREVEVMVHRPEPFWRILAEFQAPDHRYPGTWFEPKFKSSPDSPRRDDWITEEHTLRAIIAAVEGKAGEATETRKPKRESAPGLFDLTTLQREANRRFGFSARRTLSAAQRLYEAHKLLTYPRTDSRCLPTDYRAHVDNFIDQLAARGPAEFKAAGQYLKKNGIQNQARIFDDDKVSDHFAIIPTENLPPDNLEGDDQKVYDLVLRRFLAAFYPAAVWTEVDRLTKVEGHHFRSRSRYLTSPGWYEVYGKEATDETALPPLRPDHATESQLTRALTGQEGEELPPAVTTGATPVKTCSAIEQAEQTRPPARITEARLLSLMENAGEQVKDDESLIEVLKGKGLGTPATRAEIIENLITKQYSRRADKALRATPKGILLIDLLKRIHVGRLASARLTGELEKHLLEVEQGGRKRKDFMAEIYGYANEIVTRAKEFSYEELYGNDPPLGECPLCKTREVFEQSRFYCCKGNNGREPDCRFIIWKERSGRYIDRVTVTELLRDRTTGMLDGFLTAQGKGYQARLHLNADCQLEVLREGQEGGGDEDSINPASEPIGPCPLAPTECKVFATAHSYRCEAKCIEEGGRRKIGVTLPRIVCQREITEEEAKAYFSTGKTEELTDLISRFGRPFAATLVLQENGRHTFEFKPREGKPRAAGTDGKARPAAKKKAPAKKVAAKKTPAKKAAATAEKTPVKAKAAAKAPAAAKSTAKTSLTKAKAAKAGEKVVKSKAVEVAPVKVTRPAAARKVASGGGVATAEAVPEVKPRARVVKKID
jgi:DNA topoisomerase-3